MHGYWISCGSEQDPWRQFCPPAGGRGKLDHVAIAAVHRVVVSRSPTRAPHRRQDSSSSVCFVRWRVIAPPPLPFVRRGIIERPSRSSLTFLRTQFQILRSRQPCPAARHRLDPASLASFGPHDIYAAASRGLRCRDCPARCDASRSSLLRTAIRRHVTTPSFAPTIRPTAGAPRALCCLIFSVSAKSP